MRGLQDLQILVRTAERGSVSAAARELGVSPAVASLAIKRLEDELGCVLCARSEMTDAHLARLLAQEEQDGRFATPEAKAGQNNGRTYFANMHRFDLKDAQHWMEKQVYLALGTLLLGAAALEIDACPIEGFDVKLLNDALDLRGKGFTAVALVALGYRAADDFNAALPKSRLPMDEVLSEI